MKLTLHLRPLTTSSGLQLRSIQMRRMCQWIQKARRCAAITGSPAAWLLALLVLLARPSHAKAPVGRFLVDAAGVTVYDTQMKLTWQRQPAPSMYWWSDITFPTSAQDYCKKLKLAGGGWRLPDAAELFSLVDRNEPKAAIDLVAFPAAPASPATTGDAFWSATAAVTSAGWYAGWAITFDYGGVFMADYAVPTRRVRCVR